jgi:hypothetical protein
MKPYTIDAFIEDGGNFKPFHLRVSEPNRTEGQEDYYCVVHAPALFKGDKTIFGVSEEQARELALHFVKQMVGDKKLIDKAGKNVQL